MEEKKDVGRMLELMLRPGFCVQDHIITAANAAAQGMLILPGTDVRTLLDTGRDEYEAFNGGCLYVKLTLPGLSTGASVTRIEDGDVFVLDQDARELQALALAALELRQPLLNAMLSADRIHATPENKDQLARLDRGLHQLHRILNNMSDAGQFASVSHMQMQNMGSMFGEIFEKAQTLMDHTGVTLRYRGLTEEVLCLADREQLERAVWNILSNAIKFTPQGACLESCLSRQGKQLRLSITDSGCGIGENTLPTVFSRYLRQPGIEDSRYGLGLGMVMIRSAALSHGGTVLIDQPQGRGTRVTMTLAIRQSEENTLRLPIDLPSGQDLGLIELSDCLPASVYEK